MGGRGRQVDAGEARGQRDGAAGRPSGAVRAIAAAPRTGGAAAAAARGTHPSNPAMALQMSVLGSGASSPLASASLSAAFMASCSRDHASSRGSTP